MCKQHPRLTELHYVPSWQCVNAVFSLFPSPKVLHVISRQAGLLTSNRARNDPRRSTRGITEAIGVAYRNRSNGSLGCPSTSIFLVARILYQCCGAHHRPILIDLVVWEDATMMSDILAPTLGRSCGRKRSGETVFPDTPRTFKSPAAPMDGTSATNVPTPYICTSLCRDAA